MKRNEHPQLNSFTSFVRGQVSSFLFFALLRRKNEPRGLKKINLQLFADTSDKTEKATPKKRAELRKKGQVMQSREVTSNLILLITFIAIRVFGSFLYQEISSVFRVFLTGTSQYNLQEPAEAMRIFSFVVFKILKMTAPFFIIVVLMGFLGSYVQIGFLFTTETLKPKFSNLNPINGIKRLFSVRSFFELLKSIAKVIIISWVAWSSIKSEFNDMMKLMNLEIGPLIMYIINTSLDIAIKICFALLAVSIADYFFQWRRHEKDIRMSKQEIKEEYKQLEGNPEIKSRIKQKQREISMRRMLQEVPKADVVITNPTHFAVAIKYEPEKMSAPYVVAKGADYMAQRIKQIAMDNKVHIMENKPLAQALFSTVDVGKAVPPELYKAVAEVLAFVYNLEGKNPLQNK
ncbi:MAG: flagellar biosynthesis protein FlhB [Clostridiaceae bacterium]|nr:flagellar biosynthesis protein FlhB [Clostridiaceae bacterium]